MTTPLVLDTSVVIKWFLDEPGAEAARRIEAGCRDGTWRPVVPDLCYAECGNVIWKRVARGDVRPEDGAAILDAVAVLPLHVVPTRTVLPLAYALALEHGRAVYDMVFLAVADVFGAELVTADQWLGRVPGVRVVE
ncbi:MAG: type II toxin-antitoxin system VapC family toxin [Gemmatimonadales bacterium]